jgi:hypothetical protein
MTDSTKLCTKCDKVKSLKNDYYRAGEYYQKYCKECHNNLRLTYVHNNNTKYVKKPTGFIKLPKDLRDNIIYDRHMKMNYKNIWRKYTSQYPELKYLSLTGWGRNGQIPKYEAP